MASQRDFEELGRKAQQAQRAIRGIRGVATVNGIRVVVDAENRLLSISVPDEHAILQAYSAAVAAKQPELDEAMRDIRADPRFSAVSTFVDANAAREQAERSQEQRRKIDADDRYFQQRNRDGWVFDR